MDEENQFNIPEDALKKIKTQTELDDFFHKLYKQAVENMLKAEMEEHLGYKKHEKTDKDKTNNRNGYSSKTLKTNMRLSQKGSLFNLLTINIIVLITFYNTLIFNSIRFVFLYYEKFKSKIQAISTTPVDGHTSDI